MTERKNHTVVSKPGDHCVACLLEDIQLLTQDRDEWNRRALAAEAELTELKKPQLRDCFQCGSSDADAVNFDGETF